MEADDIIADEVFEREKAVAPVMDGLGRGGQTDDGRDQEREEES